MNPYMKDNGSGYPDDENGNKASGVQLLSSLLVIKVQPGDLKL